MLLSCTNNKEIEMQEYDSRIRLIEYLALSYDRYLLVKDSLKHRTKLKHKYVVDPPIVVRDGGSVTKLPNSILKSDFYAVQIVKLFSFQHNKLPLTMFKVSTDYTSRTEFKYKTIVLDSNNNYFMCYGYNYLHLNDLIEEYIHEVDASKYYQDVIDLIAWTSAKTFKYYIKSIDFEDNDSVIVKFYDKYNQEEIYNAVFRNRRIIKLNYQSEISLEL